MSKLFRKDFKELAEIIASFRELDTRIKLCKEIGYFCKTRNYSFQEGKWKRACNALEEINNDLSS